MGHDISAFDQEGKRIEGPSFSRYWSPHYEIFEAEHHDHGISGDGESEIVAPERLHRARQVCLERLESAQQSLREIEENICNAPPQAEAPPSTRQPASGKSRFIMLIPGKQEDPEIPERDKPAPQVLHLRNLPDPSDWDDDEPEAPEERLRSACSVVDTYKKILEFIDRCTARNAVLIKFW